MKTDKEIINLLDSKLNVLQKEEVEIIKKHKLNFELNLDGIEFTILTSNFKDKLCVAVLETIKEVIEDE